MKGANFKRFTAALAKRGQFRITPGLDRMRAILGRLGNPQDRLRAIHIAGTNGKGSVAAALESVMRQCGYKTGLYTSPHLIDVRERIRINGNLISADRFEMHSNLIIDVERISGLKLTYFEFLTVMAFLDFHEQQVDIAIIETGLGGAWDATNVQIRPEACVITSIGLDHIEWLGRTECAIAGQKAGIIKPGTIVISGVRGRTGKAIRSICRKTGSVLREIDKDFFAEQLHTDWDKDEQLLRFHGGGMNLKVNFGLLGNHQIDNAALVLATLESLTERGWNLPQTAVNRGLRGVCWPGRFQQFLFKDRHLIVDGAHNPHGVQRVCETLDDSRFKSVPKIFLFGVYKDKLYKEMARKIAFLADKVVLCAVKEKRAKDVPGLHRVFSQLLDPAQIFSAAGPEDALETAWFQCPENGVIIVVGSLTLAGILLAKLQKSDIGESVSSNAGIRTGKNNLTLSIR